MRIYIVAYIILPIIIITAIKKRNKVVSGIDEFIYTLFYC